MDPLRSRIQNYVARLVRWAMVVDTGGDLNPYPTQRVSWLGKEGDSQTWYPYGFNAHAPTDALSLMWAIGGDSASRVHMPGSPVDRVKVAPGEVVMYHPKTGAKVHMQEDGSIEIDSAIDVTINGGAAVNVNATDITLTGSLVVDGPTQMNNVNILGTLDVASVATFDDAVMASSAVDDPFDLSEHVHFHNEAAGDTDGPKD